MCVLDLFVERCNVWTFEFRNALEKKHHSTPINVWPFLFWAFDGTRKGHKLNANIIFVLLLSFYCMQNDSWAE